jgi:hypothetical protein
MHVIRENERVRLLSATTLNGPILGFARAVLKNRQKHFLIVTI